MTYIEFGLSFLAGVLSTLFWKLLKYIRDSQYSVRVFFAALFLRKENIRFSIAYLFRVKIEEKYLLIKGKRIDQYQPIGGVYKTLESSKDIINKYEIVYDENIKIDDISKKDLRIMVKGKYIIKILKWFKTLKNREISVHREFYEELIVPTGSGLEALISFNPEYIKTVTTNLQKSTHFNCYEILIYDIFELNLDDNFIGKIIDYMNTDKEKFVLCSYNDIDKEHIILGDLSYKIGAHAKYIL